MKYFSSFGNASPFSMSCTPYAISKEGTKPHDPSFHRALLWIYKRLLTYVHINTTGTFIQLVIGSV
ncbi:hypothetical protein HKD37_09G025761 [Glycine soja]